MATHTNLSSLFTDIADSIRSVSGGTASIQADTFPTAIQSLGSGFAKIQTGSYVGTGTYGASNPCSLTFDFTPIYFQITTIKNLSNNSLGENQWGYAYGAYNTGCLMTLLTDEWLYNYFTSNLKSCGVKKVDKQLIWYSQENESYQHNSSNYLYYYMFF